MIDFHPIAQIDTNAHTTYWLDLWDEQLRLYLVHFGGFDFWNVRVALDILIEDSTRRHHQSKGIRSVLGDTMRLAAQTHPLLRAGSLHNELEQLISDFEKRERVLARNRARFVAHQMDSRPYSEALVSALSEILEKPGALSKRQDQDLWTITSDIVARLFRVGFGARAISDVPRRLFSTVVGVETAAGTHFPRHYLEISDSGDERPTWLPLTESERVAIQSLTLRQRIATLAKFMHATPHKITCIFGIEGLMGTASSTIGSVLFYSPAVERFLPGGGDTELMGQDPLLMPVNAKVEVSALDGTAAREQARGIVEQTLNVMSLGSPPPPPLAIRNNRWAIVDPMHPGLYGFTEPVAKTADNLPYYAKSLAALAAAVEALHAPPELIAGNPAQQGLIHELSTSLHWLRRAKEASRSEDSLLFHWLAFEKLFDDPTRHEPTIAEASGSFDVIELLYPILDAYIDAHLIRVMAHNYVNSFWDIGMRRGLSPRFGPNAYQTLVGGIAEADGDELLSRLRGIAGLSAPARFTRQVKKHIDIVDDYRTATVFLGELVERSRRQIRITYWLRNRMVHGGDFGFSALPYYSELLDYGTRALLTVATDTRNWRDEPQHPVDILLSFYGDAVSMLRDLKLGAGTLDQCLAMRPTLHPY